MTELNELQLSQTKVFKNRLNKEDEDPTIKPELSKPLTHESTGTPLLTLVPKYFISVNVFNEGSKEPNSNGFISITVEFKL